MIDIAELRDKDIGRWVEYNGGHGTRIEKGKIKGWNHQFIFVVYKCRGEWYRYHNFTGSATSPEHLNFIEMKGGNDEIQSK